MRGYDEVNTEYGYNDGESENVFKMFLGRINKRQKPAAMSRTLV